MSTLDCCSFCGRPRSAVRAMVAGASGRICDRCIKLARTGQLYVAHCVSCTPKNGQHAPTCTDSCEAS